MENPFADDKKDEKSKENPASQEPSQEDLKKQELAMLRDQAKLIGLDVPPNIGAETLRARIKAKVEGEMRIDAQPSTPAPTAASAPAKTEAPKDEETPREETPQEMRVRLYKEARRLIRVRITCMDPKKADLKGEVLTIGNKFIGKVSRFVPYGEHCGEDGTHVEYALLQMMKERRFVIIKKGKNNVPYAVDAAEYAIEELPQLTQEQLRQLAVKQAAKVGA